MITGDGNQAGDVSSRDHAGRDMYRGMTPDELRQTLRDQNEFFSTLVMGYERLYRDIHRDLDRVEDASRLWDHTFKQRMRADDERQVADEASRAKARRRLTRRLTRMEIIIILIAIAVVVLFVRLYPYAMGG